MFSFVSDVRTEVAPNDTMPGGVVFLIKFFLDVGSNVLTIHED
jgi:hypothetical protein